MTLEQFSEYLDKQPISDKLVHMRYKYSWEDRWSYSNEILEVDDSAKGNYSWLCDWYEGQDEVEILGCISIDEVEMLGCMSIDEIKVTQFDENVLRGSNNGKEH